MNVPLAILILLELIMNNFEPVVLAAGLTNYDYTR